MPITVTIAADPAAQGQILVYLDSVPAGASMAGAEVAPGESVVFTFDFPPRGVIHTLDPADEWVVDITHDLSTVDLMLIGRSGGGDIAWQVDGQSLVRPRLSAGATVSAAYVGSGEVHAVPVPSVQQQGG